MDDDFLKLRAQFVALRMAFTALVAMLDETEPGVEKQLSLALYHAAKSSSVGALRDALNELAKDLSD